jgi:uncharacterized membrane protein (DUF485 family)
VNKVLVAMSVLMLMLYIIILILWIIISYRVDDVMLCITYDFGCSVTFGTPVAG